MNEVQTNSSNEDIRELIKQRRISSALQRLYEIKHPIMNDLFPRLKLNFSSSPSDLILNEYEINELNQYLNERATNGVILPFILTLIGGFGVCLGLLGLASILNLVQYSAPISMCCALPLGLPYFVWGIYGLIEVNKPDFGLW